MSTQLAREREENARLAEEETDFERIVSMGLGPLDALDPEQEVRPAMAGWAWSEGLGKRSDKQALGEGSKDTQNCSFACFIDSNR